MSKLFKIFTFVSVLRGMSGRGRHGPGYHPRPYHHRSFKTYFVERVLRRLMGGRRH